MRQRSRFNTPELLEALRNRNSDAWQEFYEEQWRPLCMFIRTRLSRSPNAHADSEDMAQEVISRAYMGIIRFRGEALLETWLLGIAQHALIDWARAAERERRLRKRAVALERQSAAIHPRTVPEPEASALGQDLRRRLLREIHEVLGPYDETTGTSTTPRTISTIGV
jgi:RNA polymerase sigma factor (sigma-70 family)